MGIAIDCKQFVDGLCFDLERQSKEFFDKFGVVPCLALLRVDGDAASEIYVNNKVKLCSRLGINSRVLEFPNDVRMEVLERAISDLNADDSVNGILLQLPLPVQLNEGYLMNLINPVKDVDGLTVVNQGNLALGNDGLFPCTPSGITELLKAIHGNLSGKHAVVVGRSLIVGRPMAQLLLRENCSVTVLHSRSESPEAIAKTADILVAAVGKPRLIDVNWVKPGATVIDVGINRIQIEGKSKLVGDVDFDSVVSVADYVTKVPGGIGPITVVFLMKNTIKAAYLQKLYG